MPIILVVDDSETDRLLVGGLLRPKLDWIVQYAKNGVEGLAMMNDVFPDVVVTDLQMPEMNGIELCNEAKKKHPHVPIILITGRGSEELAVEALSAGAASYVPKSALAGSLLDTVEQVLSFSGRSQSIDRLMKYNTHAVYRFCLKNQQSLIATVTDFVKHTMESLELGDAAQQRHGVVSVEEALINAMFHGNLELDGLQVQEARRAMHEGGMSEEARSRITSEPYCNRRVYLEIKFNPTAVSVRVRDEGPGFDAAGKLESADDLSQLSGAGGRGLTLIRSFMDVVEFNEDGNEIQFKLKLQKPVAIRPSARKSKKPLVL